MTDFTNYLPAQTYPDIITLNNSNSPGAGMTTTLVSVQDGLGNSSPMQISTNAVNFNTTGGNTFQFNGVPFVVTNIAALDDLTQANPTFAFTNTAVQLPLGTAAERPNAPANGMIRYNSTIDAIEAYYTSAAQWYGLFVGTAQQYDNLKNLINDPPSFNWSDTALSIPSGNSLQRPNVPVDGMIRYNVALGGFEFYNSGWVHPFLGSINVIDNLDSILGGGVNNYPDFSWNVEAIQLPSGDIADRPIIGVGGLFRYNSETNVFEGYVTGQGWKTFTVS